MIEKGYYFEQPNLHEPVGDKYIPTVIMEQAHNAYRKIAIDSAKPNTAVLAGPQSIQDGDSFTPNGTKIKHTPKSKNVTS